jgi:VWFA-related protein
MRRPHVARTVVVAAALSGAAIGAQTPAPPQQPAPVFRAGTTVVPLDVRVIDGKGQPVTDLKQSEFVVLENGARQQIRFFAAQALTAIADVPAEPLVRRASPVAEVSPQNHRVFLIVLGRGRLQEPAKGMDAVVDLVKSRLLPQDYVGVMAWNRATDFTTDHANVLDVVERFRKQHDGVEALMKQRFSGLTAMYGGSAIPAGIQKNIDAIFFGPNGPGVRELPTQAIGSAARVADDTRRATDALQRADVLANRTGASLSSIGDDPTTLGLTMSLDEYVELNSQSMQDLTNLYTAISYLRYVPGEKHLLFVSERGIFLPRTEDDRGLAQLAADARVAVDIIHTGGTPPPAMGRGGRGMPAFQPNWQVATSQTVAEMTGGLFTSVSNAKTFIDRVDTASRFQYTLAYTPSNATMDGKYRRIQVRVTRPGVRVLYRHGYFARSQMLPLDRERIVTYSRVTTAANYSQDVHDIGLTVTAANATPAGAERFVDLTVQIAPARLSFSDVDGRKKGAIDIAVFCGDDREQLVGQSWNTVALEMTPEAFQRFLEKGLTYSGKVSVSRAAKHVKVVVYDAGADLVGSAAVKIK